MGYFENGASRILMGALKIIPYCIFTQKAVADAGLRQLLLYSTRRNDQLTFKETHKIFALLQYVPRRIL